MYRKSTSIDISVLTSKQNKKKEEKIRALYGITVRQKNRIRPYLRKKIVWCTGKGTCVPHVNVLNNNLRDYLTSLSEWTFHINTNNEQKTEF